MEKSPFVGRQFQKWRREFGGHENRGEARNPWVSQRELPESFVPHYEVAETEAAPQILTIPAGTSDGLGGALGYPNRKAAA